MRGLQGTISPFAGTDLTAWQGAYQAGMPAPGQAGMSVPLGGDLRPPPSAPKPSKEELAMGDATAKAPSKGWTDKELRGFERLAKEEREAEKARKNEIAPPIEEASETEHLRPKYDEFGTADTGPAAKPKPAPTGDTPPQSPPPPAPPPAPAPAPAPAPDAATAPAPAKPNTLSGKPPIWETIAHPFGDSPEHRQAEEGRAIQREQRGERPEPPRDVAAENAKAAAMDDYAAMQEREESKHPKPSWLEQRMEDVPIIGKKLYDARRAGDEARDAMKAKKNPGDETAGIDIPTKGAGEDEELT